MSGRGGRGVPYLRCVSAVGWAEWTNFDAADTALTRSLYHVVALHEEAVIGMARVVGDGAMFFYIQDVVVVPAHQGRGVGTLLLERVMGYLTGAAPEKAFIGLFAAEGMPPYYARFGFAAKYYSCSSLEESKPCRQPRPSSGVESSGCIPGDRKRPSFLG